MVVDGQTRRVLVLYADYCCACIGRSFVAYPTVLLYFSGNMINHRLDETTHCLTDTPTSALVAGIRRLNTSHRNPSLARRIFIQSRHVRGTGRYLALLEVLW